ncbi:hypothetical protein G443_000310 [Actinoalloteichus cyanogriseus DSM 43889]|uniref:DUF4878 domain-containing protein n=1 Tax=Actinoalloteichus caeruleus DSM 43889 TaxID=1120930 RepID=A0ABT1JC23_ACTCY|nr:hypothetical protein [Actinoalloteichus caeruleus DSM 43889]
MSVPPQQPGPHGGPPGPHGQQPHPGPPSGGWPQQGPPTGGWPQQPPPPQAGDPTGGWPRQPQATPVGGWPQQGPGGQQYPHYGPPHGYPPPGPGGPPKKSPLPWVLGGGGVLVIVLAVVLVLVLTGDDDTPSATGDGAPTTGQDAGGDEPPLGQDGTDAEPPAGGGRTSTDIDEVARSLVTAMSADDRQTLLAHTCTSRAEYFDDAIERLDPAAALGVPVPPEVAAALEQVEASYEFEAAAVMSEVEAQAIFRQHLSNLPPELAGFPTTARIGVWFVEENGWKMCDIRLLDDEEVPPAR